ncbi:MAG: AAA family ATPase, partial [Alcanivoracaceae bacterium]|nr:AAA family ATPase [Alcanivoracaceae bacterium]
MSARDWLDNACRRGVLDALDVMLAQSLVDKAGEDNEQLLWLVALLSYQHRQGHVCMDLQRAPAAPFDQPDCPWRVPSLESVQQYASALIGSSGEGRPLVLDGPRLYLRRHWIAEQLVAQALRARCVPLAHDATVLKSVTESIFNGSADIWQRAAAVNCALHRFGVITGGPGTGKTWTVTRMLALQCLLALHAGRPLPRIAMAAPTGKAAARLTEALQTALPGLPVADSIKAVLPDEAVTLHRLLAMDMHGAPRHHRERPLPFDLVVVDEASMIDLGLMAQLTAALPDDASLYLVGDRDQLASVQAGSVFADVCGDADNRFDADTAQRLQQAGIDVPVNAQALPIDSAVVRLQKVHRFAGDSAIAAMANAVRSHDGEALENL